MNKLRGKLQRRGETPGLTVLAVLLGIGTCFSQTTPAATAGAGLRPNASSNAVPISNPYDGRLAVLQEKWNRQNSLERAVTLRRIYALREFVTAPDAITRWIDGVMQEGEQSSVVHGQAQHYRALMEVHSGRTANVPPLPAELLVEARAALAKEPNSAEVNEALGLVERERGSGAASEHQIGRAHV